MENDIQIVILEDDDLPFRSPPLKARQIKAWGTSDSLGTRVVCTQQVFEAIENHAKGDQREVGGWLLGQAYRDQGVIYIEISVYLPAKNQPGNQSSSMHFNFSADIKAELWKIKDREYPDLRIVGWFHSHPNHGIFLSPGMDTRIQKDDFPMPWHTALVYDPVRHEGGFFIWSNNSIVPAPGFYELFDKGRRVSILTWRNLDQIGRLKSKWLSWSNPFLIGIIPLIIISILLGLTTYSTLPTNIRLQKELIDAQENQGNMYATMQSYDARIISIQKTSMVLRNALSTSQSVILTYQVQLGMPVFTPSPNPSDTPISVTSTPEPTSTALSTPTLLVFETPIITETVNQTPIATAGKP